MFDHRLSRVTLIFLIHRGPTSTTDAGGLEVSTALHIQMLDKRGSLICVVVIYGFKEKLKYLQTNMSQYKCLFLNV